MRKIYFWKASRVVVFLLVIWFGLVSAGSNVAIADGWNCGEPNFVFLVDTSTSNAHDGIENWENLLTFFLAFKARVKKTTFEDFYESRGVNPQRHDKYSESLNNLYYSYLKPRFSIIRFGTHAYLYKKPTSSFEDVVGAVNYAISKNYSGDSETNAPEAFKIANQVFDQLNTERPNSYNILITFSDAALVDSFVKSNAKNLNERFVEGRDLEVARNSMAAAISSSVHNNAENSTKAKKKENRWIYLVRTGGVEKVKNSDYKLLGKNGIYSRDNLDQLIEDLMKLMACS
ncbi:MAG: VWA domain-containing protein [Bdellovibrionales bacterium]|nr:VWA domain-containing protein [Bdellovibrionales bacterium]